MHIMKNQTHLQAEISIQAPPADVWSALSNLSLVQQYTPGVKLARHTTEQRQGVGAGRHCDLEPFGSVEEVVTEWQENRRLVLAITAGAGIPPIREMTGRFDLIPAGSETLVRTLVSYTPEYGWVGRLLGKLAIKPRFQSMLRGMLEGLKEYVEDRVLSPEVVKFNAARPTA
ncbi:MAG TPA: hypothetical protein DCY13_16625 [Verrucomicrobiales bacterium]|nr:hypothetical protein [Verrucomicrobiales bacterium]